MQRHDPKTNREMSTPLGNEVEAKARLDRFGEDLAALRIKHHVLDLVAVWDTCYDKDQGEGKATGSVMIGNHLDCLLMAKAMSAAIRLDVEDLLEKAGGG